MERGVLSLSLPATQFLSELAQQSSVPDLLKQKLQSSHSQATQQTTPWSIQSPPNTSSGLTGIEISAEDAELLLDLLPAPEQEEANRITAARSALQTFLLKLRQ